MQELEKQQRPLEDKVLDLLAEDPDTAFTLIEIAARIEAKGDTSAVHMIEMFYMMASYPQQAATIATMKETLTILEENGLVRSFRDSNTVYYAIAKTK